MRLAGLLENEVKEYEEALYILEKCSRDYGNFETGVTSRLKMISLLNDKIKDSSRTIDSCRAFIQLYPEHEKSAPVYKQLADLYRAEGNNEDSRKVLDQLIKNFPDSEIAQRTILDSAEIYRAERNYQKEAEELTRFVEKFPESAEAPKAALMIGQIHARNLIVYKRKMGTDGTLYKLKRGSYRDAIKKYEEAYQLYPETAFGRQALLEAANVYLDSLYEKSKAEEVLKTLVDVHANTAEGLKAKELIKARM
jgi:outer membrane protein assembly factor BamD (BamD/ComL family)